MATSLDSSLLSFVTPIPIASQSKENQHKAFIDAVKGRDIRAIISLLDECDIDINYKDMNEVSQTISVRILLLTHFTLWK